MSKVDILREKHYNKYWSQKFETDVMISEAWNVGGTVCDYTGGEYKVKPEEQPTSFEELDDLLLEIAPKVSFLEYKKIMNTCVTIEEDDDWGTVPQYVPAEDDTAEVRKLLHELREVVDKLKERGVNSYWIESLINDPGKLSRLVVTRDHRIILPDYNNMEISMTPIVKAVYLLFLRHPEGINYKDLVDYRKELTSIYESIKGERADSRMSKSICDLTDPTKNSINEKVARIREAFVTRFKESLSTNYIVNGERGEAKRVLLNRELVTWE
jgi:hypothetical protein